MVTASNVVLAASVGGHGTVTITGSRFDLLDKEAPAWQETVMQAAASAGMPLFARKIGRAHKHAFWRIEAASPEEAQAESARIKAEKDSAKAEWDASSLRSKRLRWLAQNGIALSSDEAVITEDGDIIIATEVIAEPIRSMFGTVPALMLVDGEPLPFPSGASVQSV